MAVYAELSSSGSDDEALQSMIKSKTERKRKVEVEADKDASKQKRTNTPLQEGGEDVEMAESKNVVVPKLKRTSKHAEEEQMLQDLAEEDFSSDEETNSEDGEKTEEEDEEEETNVAAEPMDEEEEEEESIFQTALRLLPNYIEDKTQKRAIGLMKLRKIEPMRIFSAIKDELEGQSSVNPIAQRLLKKTLKAIKKGPPEKKKDPNQKFKPHAKMLDKNLKRKVLMTSNDTSVDLSCLFVLGMNYQVRTDVVEYTSTKSGSKKGGEKELMRVVSIVRLPADPTKSKAYKFNIPLRYVSPIRFFYIIL